MTNRPIEVFRAGTIEIAVWENPGENSRPFQSLTAKRSYRDENGEWKDAGNVFLLPQHLPDMILVLQKAHEFVRMNPRSLKSQRSAENDQNEERSPAAGEQEFESSEVNGDGQPGFADRVQEGRRSRRTR